MKILVDATRSSTGRTWIWAFGFLQCLLEGRTSGVGLAHRLDCRLQLGHSSARIRKPLLPEAALADRQSVSWQPETPDDSVWGLSHDSVPSSTSTDYG